ncbi:FAD-dependent oxidoreductase [Coraliomargarita sp. SDUM461004]|uniref:FAD-dependent oxidoreductase n=1 Tax=Thalassobacterium sedimentorum TaxID=3041258 RepID=A0ABU1ALF4_9BACT|nr:FAD-dependent oxidoreductase [Coraliomargarita sp. SDUM461004]MDQ8194680.1 FAD-dependent oxidoreductase [Coraliomargarita sp. SDUM461004]
MTTPPDLPTDTFDIIIMGGGPSGTHAGIAAARAGHQVLVVEKHAFLGGSLTAMGVGPMMSFHNPAGEQVVMGQPEELIQRLMKKNASPGHIPDSVTYCSTVTPFDSEALKIELETMLLEAGGHLLYHTHFAGAETDESGKIVDVTLCNKAGLRRYKAKVFIDATGDGDLAAALGAKFAQGRASDHATQPMTMNLKIGNVDIQAVRQNVFEDPDNFEFDLGAEEGLRRLKNTPRVSLKAYKKTWKDAQERGEVNVPRECVLFFETATPGVVIVNTSRIQGLDGTNPYHLSKAEVIGRKQNLEIFNFLKTHCKGFENAIQMDGAAQIGIRETRRIEGLYTLTAEDVLNEVQFPDPIALGGYPIDIHSPDKVETNSNHLAQGTKYQIPMRCLLPQQPNNLIVAGRCISATHEAMAAFRVSPIAMAIGQAAGTMAAVAVEKSTSTHLVDYQLVRQRLIASQAKLPELT